MIKKTIIAISGILWLAAFKPGLGYDFKADSQKIATALFQMSSGDGYKVAVLFNKPSQAKLKQLVDLVQLKSELTNELANSFRVTDPFFVSDYLESKQLRPQEILATTDVRQKVAADLENSHFLMVDMVSAGNNIIIKYSLAGVLTPPVLNFSSVHPIAGFDNADETSTVSSSEKIYQSVTEFSKHFSKNAFNTLQAAPWSHYHPTAFLNTTDDLYVNFSLWLKDVAAVDVGLKQLRVDYRIKIFELGIAEYYSEFDRRHSGYFHAKVNLVNQGNTGIPFYGSLGIKVRYYWDDTHNHNFLATDTQSQIQKDKDADALSFYIALNYSMSDPKLLWGAYLDNLYAALDVDWFLPYRLVGSGNLWLPRISGDFKEEGQNLKYSDVDFALTLKHLSANYFNLYLSYQVRPALFTLGSDIYF